ncbi:MAG TPA: hypothetical protein VGG02_01180 [Chthoniobacterales bacterium]
MSLSKLPLAIILVLAAAGAAVALGIDPDRNKTPWTLEFDQPTLVDPTAFIAALDHASQRWERKVTIKQSTATALVARPDVTQIPTHAPATPGIVRYPTKNQKGNPSSLHVTQKIGLYNKADLDAIQKTIQYP